MYRSLQLIVLAFASISSVVLLMALAKDPPPKTQRPDQWKKVDEAIKKGLPKTAIELLEPIIEGTLKDKHYPEAILAIGKKIVLEGQIQGNKPEERITRLQAELQKAPEPMQPVMHALLAHWYWDYYQQNRWRFVRRTQTSAPPGADFTTWDLPRLFAEIDKRFTQALANTKELKAIPVQDYDALFVKGTVPDSYRPTLYDILAHEALQFYTAGEQAGARAQDAFDIDAQGPALGNLADFLAWKPTTTDETSNSYKAVKIYQELLTFHQNDQDRSALLDADLSRLQWVHSVAFGEEKSRRYIAQLKAFADANAQHELSALARYRWASIVSEEGDHTEAKAIARQGANAFPNSPGGKLCANLIIQIEEPTLSLQTERVWNEPWPAIQVTHKNVQKLYFRAIALDWEARLTKVQYRPEDSYQDGALQELLRMQPTATWEAALPATPDDHPRTTDVQPPANLKPGFYVILASTDPQFTPKQQVLAHTDIWVSQLSLVTRFAWNTDRMDGFVLTAQSGEPITGAKIRSWYRSRTRNNTWVSGPTAETDANGRFELKGTFESPLLLLAEHQGQKLSSANEFQLRANPSRYNPAGQSVLFTDRSLYRPGQMVHYKGIALLADTEKNNYRVLPNESLEVTFRDMNGKEIAKQQVRSNDYGSFSGTFTAPRDRATGMMTLLVTGNARGAAQIRVEEYKRPKFQVTLEKPKEATKLLGDVKISGKAITYSGVPLGGASVRYRVTRQARWPIWFMSYYGWRIPPQRGEAQEIAHGTAMTNADGTLSITFPAKPDRSIPEEDNPTFIYTIHVDVTDTTGETRSATDSVRVGYTALEANLTADTWQSSDKPITLKLKTETLDGEGQAAEGTIKIHRLKAPEKVQRAPLGGYHQPFWRGRGRSGPVPPPEKDFSNPLHWDLGDVIKSVPFKTPASGNSEHAVELPVGNYRAVVETQDRFGKPVTTQLQLQVVDPNAATLGLKIPNLFTAQKWSIEPGQEFTALWGTGYERGRAFVEIEHRNRVIQSYWTDPARTQIKITQAITEAMRGGLGIRVTYIRENRAYFNSGTIDVPWSTKDLTVKWERFISKLEPGKPEKYTATITGPQANKAVAEMVAALYDASLDAFQPHQWMQKFNVFYRYYSRLQFQFQNSQKHLQFNKYWAPNYQAVVIQYRGFPADLRSHSWGQMYWDFSSGPRQEARFGKKNFGAEGAEMKAQRGAQMGLAAGMAMDAAPVAPPAPGEAQDSGPEPDFSKVSARKNLDELAFFFPHMVSASDGSVTLEFTMPEALTKWKFMGFVHDKELRSGYLQDEVMTAKDLMVQPNPPRFLREGDVIELTAKVSNQSATRQVGKARLTLVDARTLKPLDAELGNSTGDKAFTLGAGESQTVSWRITLPDNLVTPIIYKIVGATDRLSDGEEGVIPVLSKRVLVTESLPLPIRGAQTKEFDFARLRESVQSNTLKSQTLTVQMTSQPAWYAVMALPYLMEYPHPSSEAVFNRLYANSLARHIAQSDPKIRRIFDLWKNTPALDSPLEKNDDLKSVLLEETPWLRDAIKESEARRNVGILFDDNRLNAEQAQALAILAEMQHPDGAWPWFPGGQGNDYITLYITTGFGRMRHLGVKVDMAPAIKSLDRLDQWMHERYLDILKRSASPKDNHLSSSIALYLYGRSFFRQDKPIAAQHQEAFNYWLQQARDHWLKVGSRQSQAHLAIALKRYGDAAAAEGILKSIKEHSVSTDELGLFWRDTERSWWWYHAPIETQALMIEAFDEVVNDQQAVEDAKVWLLKQKQTQNWKTTKATADAVYALLLRGSNLLSSDAVVEVSLAGTPVKPEAIEAGTGFYEQTFVRGEIKPEQGKITVKKTDPGVSWGSVTWQYLEDVAKVTPYEGTPLKLEKSVYKRVFTKTGPVLEPVKGAVAVGDELVCRIVLRTDRDMEYVHLKDQRGSGTEPVNVLSQYRFQDGLAYYESTRDTASHFFIDYLPKGVYVFEYPVRVQLKGQYPTGLASIQCLYAPEFNSHSNSVALEVK